MNSTIKLRNQASEFFLYTCFGIVKDDNLETIIRKCVKRAYLDMNRTLSIKKNKSSSGSFQSDYSKKITDIICKREFSKIQSETYDLFFNNDHPKNDLNVYLNVKKTKNKSKRSGNCFYYGQAQKWINMSLKYLWLIGIIDDEEAESLDIPIDRIVMSAASKQFNTEFPTYTNPQTWKIYSESSTMPWSKLNLDEYVTIQNDIKSSIKGQSPIEWESKNWIKYAKNK